MSGPNWKEVKAVTDHVRRDSGVSQDEQDREFEAFKKDWMSNDRSKKREQT